MKLLIIEDEEKLSQNIAAYLRQEKYVCDIAHNYHEALNKIYISPQKNRAVKNKSYFYNCYGKEKEYYIENQG